MQMFPLSIVFFLTPCFFIRNVNTEDIGPADIQIKAIEECEDPSIYSDPYDVQFTKKNRTHVAYSGCYNFPTMMDVTYKLNVTAAKWGDGGWKPNAFDYSNQDACNTMLTHVKELWTTIQRAFGVSETCPMLPGRYCVKDFVAPLSNMFPNMLYGTFRADITIYEGIQPLFCIRVFLDSIKPKN